MSELERGYAGDGTKVHMPCSGNPEAPQSSWRLNLTLHAR